MNRFIGIIIACGIAIFLAGCQVSRQVSYSSALQGEFDRSGTFAADFVFVADYDAGTFTGALRNFQFTRPGFDQPLGETPVSGTVSRNSKGEYVLKGKGEAPLTLRGQEYLLSVEIESYYIDKPREVITGGYWGGGNFSRAGAYVAWLPIKGDFRAEAVCRPNLFSPEPCPLPPPASAAPSRE